MVLAPGAFAAEAFDRKPFQSADDIVLRGPAAILGFGRGFDCRLVGCKCKIGAVGLPFRIVVVFARVPGHEFFCQSRSVRVGEIEGVVAEQHAFGREVLLHQRVLPAGGRENELGGLGQLGGVRLLHEHGQIREQEGGEDQIGLGSLQRQRRGSSDPWSRPSAIAR